MKYTANLKLKKPEGTDVVNIDDLNDNVDILDREITQVKDKANNINAGDIKLSDGKTIEGKFTEVQGNIGNINDPTLPVELKGKSLTEQTKQLFQSGLDGKNLLETSIKSKGGTVSKQDTVATFNELDLGIKSIETDKTGDATAAGDILSGKTAYVKGKKLTGTMPNRGAIDNTITTQGGQITIPTGYHNGSGKVKAQFPNLVASNIKKGINIGGVVGNYVGGYEFFMAGDSSDPSSGVRVLVDKVGTSYEAICNFKIIGAIGQTRLFARGYKPAGGSMSFRLYKNNALIETQTFNNFTGMYADFDYIVTVKPDDVFRIEARAIRSDNSNYHDKSDGKIYDCEMRYRINRDYIIANI